MEVFAFITKIAPIREPLCFFQAFKIHGHVELVFGQKDASRSAHKSGLKFILL